ncbi:MAG: DegQ family serine endoprotease [Oleispira antarctica]|uniref:Probable periplasmic serine endoprotease DegP-like n=1 Tax=Oleispira antarctica RB-8 TaxID=698738 RepID=R4YLY3_OLEAN|nr:DegQ family serine endoprotease [Oleispira antarctica]MBQ0792210.1 DegQ family serine endoprotease [Oleispira antarctica]CCK75635.1 Serine protease MucD [Oleispira antarctica RB-8]
MTSISITLLFCLSLFSAFSQASSLPDFTDLVQDTSSSVVNIATIKHGNKYSNAYDGIAEQYNLPKDMPDIFRHFFGPQGPNQRDGQGRGQAPSQQSETTSLGSGFIISSDGYILTNNHVVQGADEIIVRLSDRRELDAQLIGADERADLALLKVKATGLPEVELGNSDKLKVGEWVLAIGSPFGFDYSVTAGIVSAKGRSLPNESYVPFIQTDVAINPGNSGGPLFNLSGEVVGINSQIYTRSGGFMGVSFAIPINVAIDVVEQLKDKGKVSRGWLGVVIQEVNKDLAESFGLKKAKGALVAQLVPGSPAEVGGLLSGDIITAFNGQEINLSTDLPHRVGRVKPGATAKLNVVRNGKIKVIHLEIGALPDADSQQLESLNSNQDYKQNRLGITVSELNDKQQRSFGEGVLVQDVKNGHAGAMSGIVRGDVITLIYGERIRSVDDFKRIVESLPKGRSVPMQIIRRGAAMFIPLRLAD